MPKSKAQKSAILKKVEEKIAKMKSAVMFNYSGVSVKEIDQLRNKCREEGIDYMVAKKTLLQKAMIEKGLLPDDKSFEGEIATVFSYEDEVAPARILAAFAKEQNKIKFAGGIFEGNYIDAVRVTELSKIPSRKDLLAKVAGCLSNPLSGLVRVLNAVREDKEKVTA
ncbi:MAG: 50S ribosomal protein L10 [Candidatus Buchananbacteria bacterium]